MIEFRPTNVAQYSRFPPASSIQMITIAMQGAIPTRISPYMKDGRSRRVTTARPNIRSGAMIQLSRRASPSTLVSLKTFPISSYRTFARGGYIIRIRPIAMGIEVVPTEREVIIPGTAGEKYPIPIPTAMARKIHRVRYLSRNESRFARASIYLPSQQDGESSFSSPTGVLSGPRDVTFTAGCRYRFRFSVSGPAWTASVGQRWMHAMHCSHRCSQVGRPASSRIFPTGQTFAQTPQDVHRSSTVNFRSASCTPLINRGYIR